MKFQVTKNQIRLYESLFILYKCVQTVNNLSDRMQKENEFLNGLESSDIPLINHIILEVLNFKEEYNSYFNSINLVDYSIRISQIRDINKPIIRKLSEWNLTDFRNQIIAHTWRYKKSFTHPDSLNYNVPKNALEISLLIKYLNYAWKMIEEEFNTEINSAMEYMVSISSVSKRKKDYANLNKEQIQLAQQVNIKCLQYQKKYFLKVFLFDFTDVKK